ncbi:MAG TPA: tetratricopeptide repeat protein [Acidobacteriaceae bacterium]
MPHGIAQSEHGEGSIADLQRTARTEAEEGKTPEAIRDTQRALALDPNWKEGWWNLGTLQYEANQYQDAVRSFEKVTGYAPNLGSAWALLGLCEFELKQYPTSLAHLEKARALGLGDDAETARVASYHLALLLIREGQFEPGAAILQSAFESGTATPQVQLSLGMALLHVPLLPEELDPSKDALVRAAGTLAVDSQNSLEHFSQFIKQHPDVPFLHYEYGVRLKAAGRWSEALAEQQEEVKLTPWSPLPWRVISDLEAKQGHAAETASAVQHASVLGASKNGSREPQMIAFYSATGTSPKTTALALRERAMQDYAEGRYSEAVSGLKSWLSANPSDGTGWAVLGLSEFALKDDDNAQIHVQRGEQLGLNGSPEAIQQAKYTYALLLIQSSQFDHASEVLSSAAGSGNLQDEVRFASGLALLRIRKMPENVPPDERALINRAGEIAQLLFASRYDEANHEFDALLKQYPRFPFLHYAYGTALLAISKYKEAEAQMHAEITISPDSDLPYVRLASIALREQQPAAAMEPAEQAARLNPASAEAHYLLGRTVLQLGDTSRAVRELENAARLAPSSPEVHFNLAKAYAKSGQADKAAEERARFVELNTAAEARRQQGSQSYQGPHDASEMPGASPSNAGRPTPN